MPGSRPVLVVLAVALLLMIVPGVRADDAEVLPRGVSNVFVGNFFYPFPTTERFNKHGDPEPIASAFDNRRLDSTVFSVLRPLDTLVGGTANIGSSFVRFRYDYNILNFGYGFGITDRLTAGIDVPYYQTHNKVRAVLDPTGANVGINTACNPAAPAPGNAPVLPLGPGFVRRFSLEDVQQFLGPGFRAGNCTVPGFGFKRVESWRGEGLGDITAAFKYQYLRTEDWRLAATLGARFPTGRRDDPDDLTDIPWSPGNYAILLRLHHDYMLSNLWKERAAALDGVRPPARRGDALLDFTFRYDWNLPTDVTVRISDPANPITTNRERVTRKFGDKFEFDFAAKYYLLDGLSLTGIYRYGFKIQDSISGKLGFPYRFLEEDTDSNEQLYLVGLTYSLLPLYLEKKFPLPLSLSLFYRDRFAGRGPSNAASPSQILHTRYINFTLQVPF